jgi:hypothetical protein
LVSLGGVLAAEALCVADEAIARLVVVDEEA